MCNIAFLYCLRYDIIDECVVHARCGMEIKMTQLTVRGIDEALHRALKEASARQEISMNRYLVRVLNEAVGQYQVEGESEKQEHTDLDHLAGAWSEEDADEFDQVLASQRVIDEAMWS